MSSASTRIRRSKNGSETEAVFDFRFNSVDDDSESGERVLTRETHYGTIRKKSVAQKYAVSDETICVQSDTGLHRSGSDQGTLILVQTDDSNPEAPPVPIDPHVVQDATDLQRRLEMMHDRCIARNLRAAGLGGYEADQDDAIYGVLDPNARMATGEPMLIGTMLCIEDQDRQVTVSGALSCGI